MQDMQRHHPSMRFQMEQHQRNVDNLLADFRAELAQQIIADIEPRLKKEIGTALERKYRNITILLSLLGLLFIGMMTIVIFMMVNTS